jgi:hypothetical protein
VRCPIETADARFQLSLWRDGLPVDSIPRTGWLEIAGF